jgi:F0F1-type ATP synthase epsilon subunit
MEIPNDISVNEFDFFSDIEEYFIILVSSGSVAVHPDSSVQLLAEEATLVENLDAKVNEQFQIKF